MSKMFSVLSAIEEDSVKLDMALDLLSLYSEHIDGEVDTLRPEKDLSVACFLARYSMADHTLAIAMTQLLEIQKRIVDHLEEGFALLRSETGKEQGNGANDSENS